MDIRDIPTIIFRALGKNIQDVGRINSPTPEWRKIYKADGAFGTVLVLRESTIEDTDIPSRVVLSLYENEDAYSPVYDLTKPELVEISAGPHKIGLWAKNLGNLYRETCLISVSTGIRPVRLQKAHIAVAAIITAAYHLQENPDKFELSSFWDGLGLNDD
jgi:hypothetical protein